MQVARRTQAAHCVVREVTDSEVAVRAQQSTDPTCPVVVVDVEKSRSDLADGAATALSHSERVVLFEREVVLPPERLSARPHAAGGIGVHPFEKSVAISGVAGTLLGRSAGLAEGVAAEAAALLDREVFEGPLCAAVSAPLALGFHQNAPLGHVGVLGEAVQR